MKRPTSLTVLVTMSLASPLAAQNADTPDSSVREPVGNVYKGDYLNVGIGAGYGPSYSGSDDYVVFPLPVIQGSLAGVGISPRPAGLALNFMPNGESKIDFTLGVVGRLNRDRAKSIEDPVVRAAGKLDTAIEVGPTVGVSFSGLLNPFDGLTFSADALWDVAGAHGGVILAPGLTYFTPLDRGTVVSLSVGSKYIDDDYADYYYTVTSAQSFASGLPQFDAEGGFESVGANVLAAIDLDGSLRNGGLSVVAIGGYSRLVGDAKRTPYTSLRGDADQWFAGAGVAYTF